jgi:hypothetical protein
MDWANTHSAAPLYVALSDRPIRLLSDRPIRLRERRPSLPSNGWIVSRYRPVEFSDSHIKNHTTNAANVIRINKCWPRVNGRSACGRRHCDGRCDDSVVGTDAAALVRTLRTLGRMRARTLRTR